MSYVSIRTATLKPGIELLFDVYVHYQEEYLRYKAVSQAFDPGSLERFRLKKVKKVFIPESQEGEYLKYLDSSLDQLKEPGQALESRAELANDTLKQESDNISRTLESEEAFRQSGNRIHKVVDFMMSEPKALAGILKSAGISLDDSTHGSTVSTLALGVGTLSGAVSRDELTDLAIAGLLHDGGLLPLGFDARTTLLNVAKEKRADFRRHPALAVEQLAGKKYITASVLRIIEDHEEYGNGLGFPGKKNYAKLKADSRIFNLCDAFDHFSIQTGKSPADCVENFISERGDHFDISLLEALEKQIKA